jgi:hypothetical protein
LRVQQHDQIEHQFDKCHERLNVFWQVHFIDESAYSFDSHNLEKPKHFYLLADVRKYIRTNQRQHVRQEVERRDVLERN